MPRGVRIRRTLWERSDAVFLNRVIEEIFTRYGQVCATYPLLDLDTVSCHNDLKPETIVFDGNAYGSWAGKLLS